MQSGSVTERFELFAEAYFYCKVNHRNSRNLAQIRNGSGCARINLNNIYFSVCNYVLNIYNSDRVKTAAESFCCFNNPLSHAVVDIRRRIDRNTVTGMYSGSLYMLHYSRNKYVLTV